MCEWFKQKTGQKCSTAAIGTVLLALISGTGYKYRHKKKEAILNDDDIEDIKNIKKG